MKITQNEEFSPVENIRIGGITKDNYVYILVGGYDCKCDRVCNSSLKI